MVEEIIDVLADTYKNLLIDVEYEYLRVYKVTIQIMLKKETRKIEIKYVYNYRFTFDSNMNELIRKINYMILKEFTK